MEYCRDVPWNDVLRSPCVTSSAAGALLLGVAAVAASLLASTRQLASSPHDDDDDCGWGRWMPAARVLHSLGCALCVAALFLLLGVQLLASSVVYYGSDVFLLCSAAVALAMTFVCSWKENEHLQVARVWRAPVRRFLLAVLLLLATACVLWTALLPWLAGAAQVLSDVALLVAVAALFLLSVVRFAVWHLLRAAGARPPPYAPLVNEERQQTTSLLQPVVDGTESAAQNAFAAPRAASLEEAERCFARVLQDPSAYADREPTESAEEKDATLQDGAKQRRHGRAFFLRTFRSEWLLIASSLLVAVFAALFTFAVNIYWGLIVGLVAQAPAPDSLTTLLVQSGRLLLLTGVAAVTSCAETALIRAAALRITAKVRLKTFQCLVDRPMHVQDLAKPGELMSRLTNDVEHFSAAISTHVVRLFKGTIFVVAGLSFLFYLSWELTLGLMAAVPLIAVVTVLQSRAVASATTLSLNASARAVSVAEEVFAAIRTVKAFRTQDYEANRYSKHAFASYLFGRRLVFVNGLCDVLVRLAFETMVVGGIYFAGRRVLQGEGTVGETVTYLLVVMDLMMHVEMVPEAIGGLSEGVGASVSLVRIIHDQATQEEAEEAARRAAAVDNGRVGVDGTNQNNNNNNNEPDMPRDLELQDVSFTYPSRPTVAVIRELSLRVPSGHTVAIVGKSGSGKTSLVSLLLRLYAPSQGRILLGGRPIASLTEKELSEMICLVPQEPILFQASVLDNICYGRRRDLDEATAAAVQANADGFIRELPQSYDTDVGSHGTLLSGGQRQRLCIARALIHNPKCLVLDEPTASLDSESELVVVATLRRLLLMRDRIVVLVTHHLALMEHVDEVALLDKGQIIAFGSHHELMQSSPAYQRHFNLG